MGSFQWDGGGAPKLSVPRASKMLWPGLSILLKHLMYNDLYNKWLHLFIHITVEPTSASVEW